MTDQPILTKAQLMAAIEPAWERLTAALDGLTDTQRTVKDAEGWTAKDHVVHVAHWERSVLSFLQGEPRYVGLGVSKALFHERSEDEVNADIQRRHAEVSWDAALEMLHDAHGQLLAVLAALGDADLQKPYRDYVPAEPLEDDQRLAIEVVYANTAQHFAEHGGYIDALAAEAD